MKKNKIYLLLLFVCLTIVTHAKDKDTALTIEQLITSVKSCPELDKQLTAKFGKTYTLTSDDVKTELKKLASIENRADCKCKISTYLLNQLNQIK